MENKIIIDVKKSHDENFENIIKETKRVLDEVLCPFLYHYDIESAEKFFRILKYEYQSMHTTIVYSLLNLLAITYSENSPQCKIVENMSSIDTPQLYDEERNRMRVRRIKESYLKRNKAHADYLKSPAYTPKTFASDAPLYDLLSDYPIVKRFLLKEEPIITKAFFDDLKLVYEQINTKHGYKRFFLTHKLEMCSKLEMFYKILTLIKKEKRRKKLLDSDVQNFINKMNYLHVVPYIPSDFRSEINTSKLSEVYNEILSISPNAHTINSIVFDIDNLVNHYIENPISAISWTIILNFIHNTVVFHLCTRIESELSLSDSDTGFELITNIQHCDTATKFFDEYLSSHSIVNTNKVCNEDITFTHFKRMYKIKSEK